MATIKSYTDLEQSKKLAEILPLESADICYVIDYAESSKYLTDHFNLEIDTYGFKAKTRDNIPCWSLSALLSVLHYPSLENISNKWRCDSCDKDSSRWILGDGASNPIDACYKTILKLHELKLL